MKTVTTRNASAVIAAREPFRTGGSLNGDWQNARVFPHTGRLPQPYADIYRESHRTAGDNLEAIYVVYSYATPIAWYTNSNGWTIPPVKYSATTTKHQGNLPARS